MSPDGQFVCIARGSKSNNNAIFRKNKDNNDFID